MTLVVRRAVLALIVLLGLTAVRVDAFPQWDLRAGRIDFYVDRLAVVADGSAHARFGDGEVRADSVYVDLRANRYLWAGDVRATLHGTPIEAAALSIDFERRVAYALIGDGEAPRVERYDDLDPASASVVAPPDDTFAFPPLRGARPYISSRHATIVPKVNIRFTPARFPTSSGISFPSPSYLYSYAPNANFGASTGERGVQFDQPYGLLGTERTLTSAHFRYDSQLGGGVTFSRHQVYGDRAYVAGSAGGIGPGARAVSLAAYQRIDARRSHTLSALSVPGFKTAQYAFTQAIRHGAETLTLSQRDGYAGGELGISTDPYPISRSGYSYRLRGGYGFDRDARGLLDSNAEPAFYPLLWHTRVGAALYSPAYRGPLRTTAYWSADAGRTFYSYPHQTDDLTLSTTISRPLSRAFNLVGQIRYEFSGNAYRNRQRQFYRPPSAGYTAPDGTPWPGYAAYSGYGSQRSYGLSAYYTPNPIANLRVNFTYTDDFPQFHGSGRPPYSTDFELRVRPGTTTFNMVLGRGYTFNWNHQTWTPRWVFSLSQ